MKAKIGDIEVGYDVHGDSGAWVLLIQGLGYARWSWKWQVEELARDFRVITYDNRGIGDTDKPPGPYTAEMMAADAVGLLDALGVDRAHIVGASLGGFTAQEIALSHASRVERLVLMCTHTGGTSIYPPPQVTLDLIASSASLPEDERLRKFIENAFTDTFVAGHPEVIDEILELRKQTAQPIQAWQAQYAINASFDASDRLRDIEAETLVLAGNEDRVVDVRNAAALAERIAGATLITLDGGHLFFVENAARFNDVLRKFLRDGAEATESDAALVGDAS